MLKIAALPKIFQSTPPAWGVTLSPIATLLILDHISIHTPRVGGDTQIWFCAIINGISIHTPRVGGD